MASRRSLESNFQAYLIRTLMELFPGCFIMKNDSSYVQGVPDLLILWNDRWAMLEVKRSADEPYQPNQEYWIAELNKMSFAAMICPENMGDVLNALQSAFRGGRVPRVPQR